MQERSPGRGSTPSAGDVAADPVRSPYGNTASATGSPARVVAVTCLLCVISQAIVASWPTSLEAFHSPNTSTAIARQVAAGGDYSVRRWDRLRGPDPRNDVDELRMFHLPGSTLYQAAGFTLLGETAQRFMFVPFTVALVTLACWWGCRVGGTVLGALVGAIGLLHPFVQLHGPVWDDATMAAALDWTLATMVVSLLAIPRERRAVRLAVLAGILLCSGVAAVTRASSLPFMAGAAISALSVPGLRPARAAALCIALGAAMSLSAWGARNASVSGSFFVGSTHDGITLWESVYPSAVEAMLRHGQVDQLNDERMADDFARTRDLSELEAHRFFVARARDYMLENPLAVARTGIIKVAFTASGVDTFEPSLLTLRNVVAVAHNVPLVLLACWSLLRPSFWRGLAAGRPAGERVCARLVLMGALLVGLAMLFIGPNSLRYRAMIEPVLWIAAASTVLDAARWLQRGRRARA